MGVEQGSSYVVAAGDTVGTIADRTNTPVRTLIDLNHLQPPYVLKSGQRLALQSGAGGGGTNVAGWEKKADPHAAPGGCSLPVTALQFGGHNVGFTPSTTGQGGTPH